MIEERAAIMCSERMRSTVAKKGGSFGGGVEDLFRVEDIIRDEDNPPLGRSGPDEEQDLELRSGECNGEVHSRLRGVLFVPRVKHPELWGISAAGF